MNDKKLRIVIADDSVVMRCLFVDLINAQPDMEVVAIAADGLRAVTAVTQSAPDLIMMDVAMPGLDGLEATRAIMHARPTPILITTRSEIGPTSIITFRALAAGALDVLRKPEAKLLRDSKACRCAFIERLRELGNIRKRSDSWRTVIAMTPTRPPPSVRRAMPNSVNESAELIAIGASTGGPQVLRTVLGSLSPRTAPPVLVVQHMSPEVIDSFAAWLAELLPLPVCVARDGQLARPGCVYIAPAHRHLRVNATRVLELDDGPLHQDQRPAVDVMFQAVATHIGRDAIGVLLTGMGADGAQGLLQMRDAGARALAQDEGSCVVYGMPKAGVLPLDTAPAVLAERLARVSYCPPTTLDCNEASRAHG